MMDMTIMNQAKQFFLNKNNGRLALQFGAFMFLQLVMLRAGNQAGRGYLSDERQALVYCFLQAAVILGFFLHWLLQSFLKNGAGYRAAVMVSVCACVAGTAVLLFVPENSAFCLVATAVSVVFLGVAGGAVYLRMAVLSARGASTGICVGMGYAAAIALQYVLQLRWTVKPALAVLLLPAFLVLTAAFARPEPAGTAFPAAEKAVGVSKTKLLFAVVITLAMLLFTSYYNSYIHHLQIATGYTEYNVYVWPRLLMIPGILLFGVIGDFKKGKLLPLCALCMVLIALLNAVLIGRETYLLNMCLFYLALTACIAYYHLTFLRLARGTKQPALWACAGRVLDSASVIASFLLGYADFSAVTVLFIDLGALTVMIVLMAVNGDFNLYAAAPREEPPTSADSLALLQERFRLTPSELNVLCELVQTDDKQEAIAARLQISVSTLRHHITSIYKKTGVQTRTALCKLSSSAFR